MNQISSYFASRLSNLPYLIISHLFITLLYVILTYFTSTPFLDSSFRTLLYLTLPYLTPTSTLSFGIKNSDNVIHDHLFIIIQEENLKDDFKTEKVSAENQNQRREKMVEDYLNSLPQNRCLYNRLLSCGYKENIWSDEIKITVTTDGCLNTEENLRQTLLASFTEYTELLKQLGIPIVKIEGKCVKICDIFSDDLTINDLKGRRAIVVKVTVKCQKFILQGIYNACKKTKFTVMFFACSKDWYNT